MPLPALAFPGVFLAALVQAFWTAMKFLAPAVIKWALISLGMGIVTYTGVDFVVDRIVQIILSRFTDLPGYLYPLIQYLGILKAFNIVVAGVVAGLTMKYANPLNKVKKFRFLA